MLRVYSQLQVCHFKGIWRDLHYQWKMAAYSLDFSLIICPRNNILPTRFPLNFHMTNNTFTHEIKRNNFQQYWKRLTCEAGSRLGGKLLQRGRERQGSCSNPLLQRCMSEVPESVSSEEADVLSASNSMQLFIP